MNRWRRATYEEPSPLLPSFAHRVRGCARGSVITAHALRAHRASRSRGAAAQTTRGCSLKQFVSIEEATPASGQHLRPCADCPWARTAIPGWLGGLTPKEWLAEAHGDGIIDCHTLTGAQCAGAAIYRANVCKSPRDRNALRLKSNRELVFKTHADFERHHAIRTNDT